MPTRFRFVLSVLVALFIYVILVDRACKASQFEDYAATGSPEQLQEYLQLHKHEITSSGYISALQSIFKRAEHEDVRQHMTILLQNGAPLDLRLPLGNRVSPELVRCFLDAGAVVESEDGVNILFFLDSEQPRAEELLKLLLQAGADPNTPPPVNHSPLLTHLIRPKTPLALAVQLLQAGANANSVSASGDSPLKKTVWCRRIDIFEVLLKAGANPNAAGLMGEVLAGSNAEMMHMLLAYGGKVDTEDKSLLLIGARHASPDLVRFLLDARVSVDGRDKEGFTALDYAMFRTNNNESACIQDILRALGIRSVQEPRNEFIEAAKKGNVQDLAKIWNENPHSIRPYEVQQAMEATFIGSFSASSEALPGICESTGWMLEQGAKLSLGRVIKEGGSPCMVRQLSRHDFKTDTIDGVPALRLIRWNSPNALGLAEALLQAGANPNAMVSPASDVPWFMELVKGTPAALSLLPIAMAQQTKDQVMLQPLLAYMATEAPADALALLIGRGAQVAAKDQRGLEPLFYAIQAGKLENARLLLQKGADPQALAVFEVAALKGLKFVSLLLEQGAQANSDAGFCALRLTVEKGTPEMVQFLIQAGADVQQKDSMGKSLLTIAQERTSFFQQTPEGKAIEKLLRTAGLNR